jgi:hypothetical protein
MKVALTAVLLGALVALTVASVTVFGFIRPGHDAAFVVCTVILWALFAGAMAALFRVRGRAAVVLVLCGAVALGGAAMAGPPNTSTDSARYAWDGIVQNDGVSPYEYVPSDDALASIRPEWLFPAPTQSKDDTPTCAEPRYRPLNAAGGERLTCTAINRPGVPTIYPAAAEMFFAAVRYVTGPGPGYWPMELAGLLMSLGITVILIAAMRRRGMDPRWAAAWAWSPFVTTEAITNSHIDILATLLVLVASLLVADGRRLRGGIALGAAIATKLIPVIAAPALLRRKPWKVIVAAVVTFAVLYVPYVIASGIGVLGYLPGYLSGGGYDSGARFAILAAVLPPRVALAVSAILLVILAFFVWRRTDPDRPWLGQLVMIGTTLLIVSPPYAWYALMLVPFIALTGRWEWFAVPAALTVRLLIPDQHVFVGALITALILVVAVAIRRTGTSGRRALAGSLGVIGIRRAPSKVTNK